VLDDPIEQKTHKKAKAEETILPSESLSSESAQQQEVIDVIEDVFDDWSEKSSSSESESESESEISGAEDDPLAASRESAELIDTDSELEEKTPKVLHSQISSAKKGWKKIDVWRVSSEKTVSKKNKKKSLSSQAIEHTAQECAKHTIEQLTLENVHSVADALLLYPQQAAVDAVCRYINQIAQHSEDGLQLISSLFTSLVYVLSSEQGLFIYKTIVLSLQHQNFSLLKTGDGPQYVLARKSMLGIDSTENLSNQKGDQEVNRSILMMAEEEEINALLDEGLEGLSDDISETDSDEEEDPNVVPTNEERASTPINPLDASPIIAFVSEEDPLTSNESTTQVEQIDDPAVVAPSLSSNQKSQLTQFLTKLLLSSAFTLVSSKLSADSHVFVRADSPLFASM
jgi:hypothetical protein